MTVSVAASGVQSRTAFLPKNRNVVSIWSERVCPGECVGIERPPLQVANEAGRRRRQAVVEEARAGIGERGVVVGLIKNEICVIERLCCRL